MYQGWKKYADACVCGATKWYLKVCLRELDDGSEITWIECDACGRSSNGYWDDADFAQSLDGWNRYMRTGEKLGHEKEER